MSAGKNKFKLIFYGVLVAVLLFALQGIFVSKGRTFFWLELIGFLFLLVLALVGFVGYVKAWGERVLFFVFLFYILNLMLIWYFKGNLYVILMVLAVIGFLLSIPKKSVPKARFSKEPHSEVFDPVKPKEKVAVAKKGSGKKVKAKHSPGKFVASARSNIYHAPKCEWAKKIHRGRRVWFKSKEEAWEKGYKAHGCVE